MTAVETRKLPMVRWSTTVRCPRQAVYAAEGAPARERTEAEERILFRGRRIGEDYASLLEANHGELAVLREVKVEWFGGIGHADVFLVPTKTIVEVLSSAHATEAMRHVKLLQMVGYLTGYPQAENGCLVVVNPVDYSEDRTIVVKGTKAYDALVTEVMDRVDQIRRYAETGELPGRVCRKPSEARGRFCQYAAHCFDGWTPPDPVSVASDPETVELARRWRAIKAEERRAKTVVEANEKERKEIEAALGDLLERAGEHEVGPFTVKRVDVKRQPTLDFKKAVLAGAVIEEMVAEFMKPGASYSTWQVEAGAGGDIDYGSHPFDDDLPL